MLSDLSVAVATQTFYKQFQHQQNVTENISHTFRLLEIFVNENVYSKKSID